MKAKIIGQNHSIIPFEFNGRKRYIIEDIAVTTNRAIVNEAVEMTGSREWATVYNEIDKHYDIGGDRGLENAINGMTY
jgi:hypothetical protein